MAPLKVKIPWLTSDECESLLLYVSKVLAFDQLPALIISSIDVPFLNALVNPALLYEWAP